MLSRFGSRFPPVPPPARLPYTRIGVAAATGHVFYELAAGVGMPFASVVGPAPAVALFGVGGAVAFLEAGRRPRSRDAAFAVLNGFLLSAVLAHFAAWPRTRRRGLPWLTECEGLSGRLMPPYNLLLYVSGVAAVGGLVETGRGRGRRAFAPLLVPAVVVPWLVREQHRDHARLIAQAQRRPGWWNRRLR